MELVIWSLALLALSGLLVWAMTLTSERIRRDVWCRKPIPLWVFMVDTLLLCVACVCSASAIILIARHFSERISL